MADRPDLRGRTICLVTPGNVGSNPRLAKEADALAAAGASVHVIATDIARIDHVTQRDREVIGAAAWTCVVLKDKSMWGRVLRAALRRLGRAALKAGIRCERLGWWAYHPMVGALYRSARKVPADLFIAHNLAALPAAFRAAQQRGARLGFDAEDFHRGELPHGPGYESSRMLVAAMEERYLPRCDYVTASSPEIAQAYAAACGIATPVVILNVFPLAEAPRAASRRGKDAARPSLYWFSQTLGPHRGLETVVEAVGRSKSRPVLHLRGSPVEGYPDLLLGLARAQAVDVEFLAPGSPSQMAIFAAQYDMGLASEPGHTQNNGLALSNKLFTFLLAGIPVLASSTPAQSRIARGMAEAVFLYDTHDADSLAARIDALCESPDRLALARQAAWKLGQERYNWDVEQLEFLRAVYRVLNESPAPEVKA